MLEKFAKAVEDTERHANQLTENGAVGYRTAGSALVDFCFMVSSYRNKGKDEIVNDFSKMYHENPLLAVKMMFMAGDIRGGMGERRLFGTCLDWLATSHPDVAKAVIPLVPEYGRWDEVVEVSRNSNVHSFAVGLMKTQLAEDIVNARNGQSISLLAKWLPSVNTSSRDKCAMGRRLAVEFGMTERQYRKTLSSLRSHLKVVETKMSANNWSEIDYNAVPSKANAIYRGAFLKHDSERRQKYLEDLKEGRAKINAGAVFPYDIVHRYMGDKCGYHRMDLNIDNTLEAMWKALPDYVGDKGAGTICMVDGSGSMDTTIGNTSITCHDVARSLGIYFAERLDGSFRNKYISFGARPTIVDFGDSTLARKISICTEHDDCSNTDIEKAFRLVLAAAVHDGLKQEEIPRNILVISDMEFDAATTCNTFRNDFGAWQETLFESISRRYAEAGYQMPRLVFWNVCSRTCTVPIQENAHGVALVSGFSPSIASMVLSEKLDPCEVVLEKLADKRYDAVEEAVKEIAR